MNEILAKAREKRMANLQAAKTPPVKTAKTTKAVKTPAKTAKTKTAK